MHPLRKQLLAIRKQSGLSQASIGEAIGADRFAVIRIEKHDARGETRQISLEEAAAWAAACGARLVLVRDEDELGALAPEERALVEMWRKLQADRRTMIAKLITCLPRLDDVVVEMIRAPVDVACKSFPSHAREGEAKAV